MAYNYENREAKSYLIPRPGITQAQEEEVVYNLRRRMVASMLDKGLAPSEQNLIVRDCEPILDLGFVNNNWRTGALVAGAGAPGAAGTNCYLTAAAAIPIVPINRILGFYKVVVNDGNPVVDQIAFRLGPTGGSALAIFDLTVLRAELEVIGFFKEPIIYEPNEGVFINFSWCRAIKAAPGEDLSFGCLICEVVGQTISPRPAV